MQTDKFMARWTGYITVPKSGNYTLGTDSDDGVRLKVNTGSWQNLIDKWSNFNGATWSEKGVYLPENTPIPIQLDWYEYLGNARISLKIKGNGFSEQEIPATWLTPDANSLPEQWKLGLDADGDVSYERIRINSGSVILEDSTGSTHEYKYTNGGYKPPSGEDGNLVKKQRQHLHLHRYRWAHIHI